MWTIQKGWVFKKISRGSAHSPVKVLVRAQGSAAEYPWAAETMTARAEAVEYWLECDVPGSTCAGGKAGELPMPGLTISGIKGLTGPLPLPLNGAVAQQVAAAAQQAPHGKGMKTVVDTSVRNTLQIDPSRVGFLNPAWQPALDGLVAKVAEELGVPARSVRCELYKALLYEKGGFFKPHRDTEKAGGMFATLVVQLPSSFSGGEFVVRHGGEERTFTLGAPTLASRASRATMPRTTPTASTRSRRSKTATASYWSTRCAGRATGAPHRQQTLAR